MAYEAILVHCFLFLIIRMIVAANASIIIVKENIRHEISNISLLGRVSLKSSNRNDEVRMERNTTTAVNVDARDNTSLTVNTIRMFDL